MSLHASNPEPRLAASAAAPANTPAGDTAVAPTNLSAAQFEALLRPVLPIAYGVAARLARNENNAEDLVQEAALQAWRGIHGFQPGTNFKAWFLRILTNCFFAAYRKHKREPAMVDVDDTAPLELMRHSAGRGVFDQTDDPAALLLGKMDIEHVSKALAALPEDYRVVNVLYFMDDLSYQEIAEVLECPLGTVRSRLHRGRRMLQKALWHVAESHGIVSALSGREAAEA